MNILLLTMLPFLLEDFSDLDCLIDCILERGARCLGVDGSSFVLWQTVVKSCRGDK
jgi:hypothetical protein